MNHWCGRSISFSFFRISPESTGSCLNPSFMREFQVTALLPLAKHYVKFGYCNSLDMSRMDRLALWYPAIIHFSNSETTELRGILHLYATPCVGVSRTLLTATIVTCIWFTYIVVWRVFNYLQIDSVIQLVLFKLLVYTS